MGKSGRRISSKIKTEILTKSLKIGCNISELSRSYNISESSIHRWRKEHRDLLELNSISQEPENPEKPEFIELAVKKTTSQFLQKASLVFDNFSVSIEGKVSSSSLLKVVQILEETC